MTPLDLGSDGSGVGSIRIIASSVELLLEYEFTSSTGERVGRVVFRDVAAYRFREELLSAGNVSGSFDTVVAVKESPWLAQLRGIDRGNSTASDEIRHFAVMISSNGFLEVIGCSVERLSDRAGEPS